ncbi:MAG: hypothetical protein JNM84_24570 [Planctomycetes bacterium]|nr:hypothetical protein [Planctomycetota bacterium]
MQTSSIVPKASPAPLQSTGLSGDDLRPSAPTWKELQNYLDSNVDVREAWKSSLISELGLRSEAAKKRQREIDRTNQIGLAIFGVVHVMLVLAMVAAGLEFASARRIRRTRSGEQTQIEVGLEGVALRTSLQGILLLTVALGFYFLYLRFVYPIVEV